MGLNCVFVTFRCAHIQCGLQGPLFTAVHRPYQLNELGDLMGLGSIVVFIAHTFTVASRILSHGFPSVHLNNSSGQTTFHENIVRLVYLGFLATAAHDS